MITFFDQIAILGFLACCQSPLIMHNLVHAAANIEAIDRRTYRTKVLKLEVVTYEWLMASRVLIHHMTAWNVLSLAD